MVRMLVTIFDKAGGVVANQWINNLTEGKTFMEYWINEYGTNPGNLLNYDFTVTFYPDE